MMATHDDKGGAEPTPSMHSKMECHIQGQLTPTNSQSTAQAAVTHTPPSYAYQTQNQKINKIVFRPNPKGFRV